MELVKNLFPVMFLGAVVLLSLVLRLESLPEFFLLYFLALVTVIFAAVMIILG